MESNDINAGSEVDAPETQQPTPDAPAPILLPPDLFPEGSMPAPGDKLVLGEPDEQGNIPATLEKSEKKGGKQSDYEQWENDFREAMRPTSENKESA